MSKTVITVEHLSKAFRIGVKDDMPDTITAAALGWIKSPVKNWQRLRRLNTFVSNANSSHANYQSCASGAHRSTTDAAISNGRVSASINGQPLAAFSHAQPDDDIIWALQDVSFEVKECDVVGIIGRNGAGKSTLLKVLSRITEPTGGRAEIRGRVSSLLEVGTGFHPELTGRENIYLNGTILGMTKREIDRKFDEIVAFSGIERFLDTPIKRYSTGMNVRLAFSVAAHLEPEILIIDEVLAVGDAVFQKKCLGKMQDVARGGRTVLFVSHNMAAIETLCSRGIILANGRVVANCPSDEAVRLYLKKVKPESAAAEWESGRDCRFSNVWMTGMRILSEGEETTTIPVGSQAVMRIAYDTIGRQLNSRFLIKICNQLDQIVVTLTTDVCDNFDGVVEGTGEVECVVPAMNLMPGSYTVTLVLNQGRQLVQRAADVAAFDVVPSGISATGKLPAEGVCILPCQWHRLTTIQVH